MPALTLVILAAVVGRISAFTFLEGRWPRKEPDGVSADASLLVQFIFKFSHRYLADQTQSGGLVVCIANAPNEGRR